MAITLDQEKNVITDDATGWSFPYKEMGPATMAATLDQLEAKILDSISQPGEPDSDQKKILSANYAILLDQIKSTRAQVEEWAGLREEASSREQ